MIDKETKEILLSKIGIAGVDVIKLIKDKPNYSEFQISEKLEMDIQLVRNILYKIHNLNLADYTKKKDRKKGGYISYWTFNKKELHYYIEKEKMKKLEKFKERLESENSNKYYICKVGCTRVEFGNAFEINFKCVECGDALAHQDNKKTIEFLKTKISEMETEI